MGSANNDNLMVRRAWTAAGSVCVGLGLIGIVLPVMPTTCFMIAALACFSKGSPERAKALLNHKRFGPTLRAWQRERAIPRHAKRIALISIMAGWLVVFATSPDWLMPALIGGLLLGISAWIITRPLPAYQLKQVRRN